MTKTTRTAARQCIKPSVAPSCKRITMLRITTILMVESFVGRVALLDASETQLASEMTVAMPTTGRILLEIPAVDLLGCENINEFSNTDTTIDGTTDFLERSPTKERPGTRPTIFHPCATSYKRRLGDTYFCDCRVTHWRFGPWTKSPWKSFPGTPKPSVRKSGTANTTPSFLDWLRLLNVDFTFGWSGLLLLKRISSQALSSVSSDECLASVYPLLVHRSRQWARGMKETIMQDGGDRD